MKDLQHIKLFLQLESQILGVLVHNMKRFDETQKEESDGVHNSLGNFSLFSTQLGH